MLLFFGNLSQLVAVIIIKLVNIVHYTGGVRSYSSQNQ